MPITDLTVADYPAGPAEPAPDTAAAQLATIVALDAAGAVVLDLGDGTPVAGRLATAATRERLEAAIRERRQVVVVFERADRSRPLVVGFLETPRPAAEAASAARSAGDSLPFIDVEADGRRLKVTAQDEIVLQCGKASITLRRNGRVIVRGTYVETSSEGTNRIKGGQVQIN